MGSRGFWLTDLVDQREAIQLETIQLQQAQLYHL